MPPVVVAHHDPDEICDTLTRHHPSTQFVYAANQIELVESLERHQPEVVFSIKCDRFPGKGHGCIVTCSSVKWIQVAGSGYEHLGKWDGKRVTVTNCAGVLSPYLAETVLGSMIALNHGFFAYRDCQSERKWQPQRFRPLAGQRLLIVGLGHIGRCLADLAKAMGMHVVGVRRTQVPHATVDELFSPETLPELLPDADVVSLHVRLNESTRHLLDRARLRSMKKDAILINTSRGAVVDETALVELLQSGHLRAAHLDVFTNEPLPPESPLWTTPNLFVTPHVADNVEGWPIRFAQFFADNLTRWLAGQSLQNQV